MKVNEIITTKIMELLEKGTIPWHKPWSSTDAPINLLTKLKGGQPYRGVNVWLLIAAGHGSPYWLTWKQVEGLGAKVKEGESKNYTVITYMAPAKYIKTDSNGDNKEVNYSLLRYYRVYNLEQVEGIDPKKIPVEVKRDFNPIEECESIVKGMPQCPTIEHKGARACYSPSKDHVTMPKHTSFDSEEHYYGTLFHEFGHATGHECRLKRNDDWSNHHFGSNDYSKEELVAEMCSAYLCGVAGISAAVIENQAAYIDGWLSRLKKDHNLIISAAARAQKAADFIMGKKENGNE